MKIAIVFKLRVLNKVERLSNSIISSQLHIKIFEKCGPLRLGAGF